MKTNATPQKLDPARVLLKPSTTPAVSTPPEVAGSTATLVHDLFEQAVVGIDTDKGLALLQGCRPEHLSHLASTMRHHQVQQNLTRCGVASAAVVVNSLGLSSRPILAQYDRPDWNLRVRYATQSSLLGTLDRREADQVEKGGMVLDRLGDVVRGCGATVETLHAGNAAGEMGVDDMRKKLIDSLESKDSRAIVNYGRQKLGQKGGGHFSPVAAYNADKDMFLVFDVAPWKAAPVWVTAEQLHQAMATEDTDAKQNRGMLIIHKGDAPVDSEPLTGVAEERGGAIVGLDSGRGLELLQGCERAHLSGFPKIMREHEIQENLALCGVASGTIVINALQLDSRPILDQYQRPDWNLAVPRTTQASLLAAHAVKDGEQIKRSGVTLDRLGEILTSAGARVETHHAGPTTEAEFKQKAIDALSSGDEHVLVNYARVAVGQKGGGHFSPLAAYNAKEDMFLVYDVAPWKADPIWVKSHELFAAMATEDSDAKQNRGFLLVSRES